MSPDNFLLYLAKLRVENDSYRHKEKVSISEKMEEGILIKVSYSGKQSKVTYYIHFNAKIKSKQRLVESQNG